MKITKILNNNLLKINAALTCMDKYIFFSFSFAYIKYREREPSVNTL